MAFRFMACNAQSRRRLLTSSIIVTFASIWLAFALVGCGLSAATPSSTGYGPSSGVPAGKSTPGATSTPTSTTGSVDKGAGSGGCPGGLGANADARAPQLVLGVGGVSNGTARPGELIQVRLSTATRWSFHNGETNVGLLQPAGYDDRQQNVCVWNFRPQLVTSLALTFTGTGLCTGKGLCPQYVFRETFYVQVK